MARHRDPPPTKALRSPICGNVGNGTRFGTICGFKNPRWAFDKTKEVKQLSVDATSHLLHDQAELFAFH
jgi:hypothetical protein